MKIRLFILLAVSLIIAGSTYAQVAKDKDGNIDLKRLSEADAERLFRNPSSDLMPEFLKIAGNQSIIKESIINGNKITTIVFNYASICEPNRLGNVADLVWQGLGYGFEFGPLAAAEVRSDSGTILNIVSDSFIRTGQGDFSPDGTEKWGWLPKDGYVDVTQDEIARLNSPDTDGDGKPDSWPPEFYDEDIGRYVWPAFLGDQATAPDEEVFFVVDDFTNREFDYFPFADSSKRGIGLDMAVRIIQFNNPLAEDIMFLVYQVTNASEKVLPLNYFGMHGDPHVGGPSDYADDFSGFVDPFGNSEQNVEFPQRSRSMVYSWDDPPVGMFGRPTGYFGWKFLESPSISDDGIDNDDDGIIDETPDNSAGTFIDEENRFTGIADIAKYTAVYGEPKARFAGDEDGDWNPLKDDVGIDGIGPDSPNYPGPDYGEGDGLPSQGWFLDVDGDGRYDPSEPISDERIAGYKWAGSELNFGLRDISESDQIGLTSFHAAIYTNGLPNVPLNDPLMWEWLSSDTLVVEFEQPGDNVFNFGTGPLSLEQGETQRFSMGILFGNDLQELILNAETATRILEADYRFAQPPAKPLVTAVPGDGRVTLYWDNRSESSVDPLSGEMDFQGYKIYRSRDYTFADVFTITDAAGNPFLGKGIAQFDVVDSLSGLHPVEYLGRGIKYNVGTNSGLVHEYVDSTVTNGIKYFYAVVAYDGGIIRPGQELPPTENQAVISRDPITGELTFAENTVQVIPGPAGKGLVSAQAGTLGKPNQVVGNSTGDVLLKILNDAAVVDDKIYSIDFASPTVYSIKDSTGFMDRFISNDTVFVTLKQSNLIAESAVVTDLNGSVIPADRYVIEPIDGKIKGASIGSLVKGEEYLVTYQYFPVFNSERIDNEDSNPVFDGIKVFVQNEPLELNVEDSEFNNSDININALVREATLGAQNDIRGEWEIRFLDLDTLADGTWQNIGDTTINQQLGEVVCPFNIKYVLDTEEKGNFLINEGINTLNGSWDWKEPIILQPPGDDPQFNTTYEIVFSIPDSVDGELVLPKAGDVFFVKTKRPFEAGDKYTFQTKGVEYKPEVASANLNEIYVVPNPYVAFSPSEDPGLLPGTRGARDIQFRNLPPECTIKIFTITGELVQTIEKNDNSSLARWDLLSFEGQRVAYGVYVFHVDIPNVGEKIGRFAVIK
jgi:hypothetical protein